MIIPFLGPTYSSKSLNIDCQRSINFYPDVNPADSKSVVSLLGTPGTSLFTTMGDIVRGWAVVNNILYVVAGSELYSVDTTGLISASLGTLTTLFGRVSMVSNGLLASGIGGNQILIVDGSHGYIYNVVTGIFTVIVSAGLISNPCFAAFMDGYFIVTSTNTMNFCVSDIYDGLTWNALATNPVQATSDTIQCVYNLHNQLWFIKSLSSEIYYDAGIPTSQGSPFQRISGAIIDYGTNAPWTVAGGDDKIFFLGTQRINGNYEPIGIVAITGYTPSVISPPVITNQIAQWPSFTDAFAYCYIENGHTFYVLTSPTADQTFVYDATTKMFHERSRWKGDPYLVGRHHSNNYIYFNNHHYISDYNTGKIFEMSESIYGDDGDPLVSVRQSQHQFEKDSLSNIFFRTLQVDLEAGVGTGGIDPQIVLSWSNDGGHTWSNEYPKSMGKVGGYKMRARWKALGYGRDRVFRIMISDPVKRVIIGGHLN